MNQPRGEKQGAVYHDQMMPQMGTWNADASDATLGPLDLSEVRNFRMETPNEYTTRTGYRERAILSVDSTPEEDVLTSNATLMAKCEYRSDLTVNGVVVDTVFDVTLYLDSSRRVVVCFYDSSSNQIFQGVVTTITQGQVNLGYNTGFVAQFNYSLIVTVRGVGTWEMYPTQGTNFASFTVNSLGKDLCPTPSKIEFVKKTSGDLFVIDNNGIADDVNPQGKHLPSSAKHDQLDTERYRYIALPLDTDYWLIDDTTDSGVSDAFAVNKPERWTLNTTQLASAAVDGLDSPQQPAARAWGYRFDVVSEYTNPKGDKFSVTAHASVDVWVPDMKYGPAQWNPIGNLKCQAWYFGGGIGSMALDGSWDKFQAPFGILGHPQVVGLPSNAAMLALQGKYRNFASDNTFDPYGYLVFYLGETGRGPLYFDGLIPYDAAVTAFKLKQAPMSVIKWSDFNFAGIAGTVKEIRVYRTAHSEADEKKNARLSPLFDPNKYGYVGSIFDGETFTDDVKDIDINFGITPEQEDSYLRGQFSGNVIREYNNRVVIGDVITDYEVLAPADIDYHPTIRVSPYQTTATTGYTLEDFLPTAPDTPPTRDGLTHTTFAVAYVDVNGNQSDATIPLIDFGPNALGAHFWIAFTFPRGYDPIVTQIRLLRGVWNNSTQARDWVLIKTMNVRTGSGVYISKKDEVEGVGGTSGETKRSTERGTEIYSEPNQQYSWPPLNFEVVHQFAPVMCMEAVTGELWSGTDESWHLSDVAGRAEEETKRVGVLSRFLVQKVDKIVFFLSQFGLYYAEASGVRPFPHSIQTEILKYLTEDIPVPDDPNAQTLSYNSLKFMPPYANARRATMGFLGERGELWLSLTSSVDLWPTAKRHLALPHKLFVFKMGMGGVQDFSAGPSHMSAYEFDLTEYFELQDVPLYSVDDVQTQNGPQQHSILDPSSFRHDPLILNARTKGGLFGTYYDINAGCLKIIDCDTSEQWHGTAAIEKSWNMGVATTKKELREFHLRAMGNAAIEVMTGAPSKYPRTHAKGSCDQRVTVWPVANMHYPMKHAVGGSSYERASTAPVTRIRTKPDGNGLHRLTVASMGVRVVAINDHP